MEDTRAATRDGLVPGHLDHVVAEQVLGGATSPKARADGGDQLVPSRYLAIAVAADRVLSEDLVRQRPLPAINHLCVAVEYLQYADMVFVVSEHARISAKVADDIFAAGRDLRVDGASADHLILVGGEVELAPGAVNDIVALGGRVELRKGVIGDDIVAVGGDVRLGRDARVNGSAVVAGGRIQIDTPIARELIAAGGRVQVNASIGGDARIRGGEILIGPNARIGGNLYVRGERIEISPQAVVQGRTVREEIPRERLSAKLAVPFAFIAAFLVIGILGLPTLIAAALPRLMIGADLRLRAHFWTTAGKGALIVLLGPLAFLALLVTVIGAPLALFLLLAYLTAIPITFAGVGYWDRSTGAQSARPRAWDGAV